MIAVAFLPLFIMSAKNNNRSQATLDSTYLGKDAMELAYDLSKNTPYKDLHIELIDNDFIKDNSGNSFDYKYYKYIDSKYLVLELKEEKESNLVRVLVKIYEDGNKSTLEVQYESLYTWKGQGILDE